MGALERARSESLHRTHSERASEWLGLCERAWVRERAAKSLVTRSLRRRARAMQQHTELRADHIDGACSGESGAASSCGKQAVCPNSVARGCAPFASPPQRSCSSAESSRIDPATPRRLERAECSWVWCMRSVLLRSLCQGRSLACATRSWLCTRPAAFALHLSFCSQVSPVAATPPTSLPLLLLLLVSECDALHEGDASTRNQWSDSGGRGASDPLKRPQWQQLRPGHSLLSTAHLACRSMLARKQTCRLAATLTAHTTEIAMQSLPPPHAAAAAAHHEAGASSAAAAAVAVPAAASAAGAASSAPSRPLQPYSCRSVTRFEKLNLIGEGTYGTVYRARDRSTGDIVALKKIRPMKGGGGGGGGGGFPLTSVREIALLQQVCHPAIIRLREVAVGRKVDNIFLVFDYCAHDLASLVDRLSRPFLESEVKQILTQLLQATEYLHANFIIHRDLKLSNLLIDEKGRLKVTQQKQTARLYNRADPTETNSKQAAGN